MQSLIFKTKNAVRLALGLASGPSGMNEKPHIALHVGESIIRADADFTRDITGYAIGGIPPMGHKHRIDFIYRDPDLRPLNEAEVGAAARTPNAVFFIKSKDWVEITHSINVISIVNPEQSV